MHMQNWDKGVIKSLPVEVRFAGFTSTTTQLAHSGWDLTMDQRLETSMCRTKIELVMRHSAAKLYAYGQAEFDERMFYSSYFNEAQWVNFFKEIGFDIIHVGADIRFQMMGTSPISFMSRFEPIDPFPSLQRRDESVHDVKFFTVLKPDIRDILLLPEDVPAALDLILNAQKSKLDEIRKREKSRMNLDNYRNNLEAPSNRIIQAQLISIS